MKNKYIFVAALLAVILLAGAGFTFVYLQRQGTRETDEELTVVTSFYPMYIAAENVVGDAEGVRLENLSEPQTGCLHDYQLTSADMKLLSEADVFIVNGGGIESFLTDVAAEYPDLTIVNACGNLELLEDNAHAWMSMDDYQVQVQTICDGLCAAEAKINGEEESGAEAAMGSHEMGYDGEDKEDGRERETGADNIEDGRENTLGTANEEVFQENTAVYLEKIQELQNEFADLETLLADEPVILFHEAYDYVADEFGMRVVGEMDLDEERQVSAGEVADMLAAIEGENVSVILAEELYGKDMGDTMEKEADVSVVYLDALTRGDYDADSWLDGMRGNLELLRAAFE